MGWDGVWQEEEELFEGNKKNYLTTRKKVFLPFDVLIFGSEKQKNFSFFRLTFLFSRI